MNRSDKRDQSARKTVRVRGVERPYLERRRVRHRTYYLLEKIGGPLRTRFLAFDPSRGPGGDFFLFQHHAAGATTQQQLHVLSRLKDDSFPRVDEWAATHKGFDVVLTWVEGISLPEYMQHIRTGRRPAVAPAQAARLIHGLAGSVCRLSHRLQITHGDIQPDNLIVTAHPSSLRLIDFGSAWTSDRATTRQEGDGQHRCYAAPELQTESVCDGFAADQFSVSVVFYELLTGVLPYDGLGGKAGRPEYVTQAAAALTPPSRVAKVCRDLPRSLRDRLDAAVVRGLALDPENRFPDRHVWLNELYELSARFRLTPELSPLENLLTRVIRQLIGVRDKP